MDICKVQSHSTQIMPIILKINVKMKIGINNLDKMIWMNTVY